jgi:hypothetical protein
VSPDKIQALLDGLVEAGVLITSLRAPMTTVDTISHLIRAVRDAGGEDLPDVAGLLHELDDISAHLVNHNSGDGNQATEIRQILSAQMSDIVPTVGQVLAVDVRLDARIAVPERVRSTRDHPV